MLTPLQARALIHSAAQYILAMSVELERRKLINNQQDISTLPEGTRKRALELSAYFTIPEMEPSHVNLALFSAMNFAQKNRQFSSALTFANNIIENGTNMKFKENVSSLVMPSNWLQSLTRFSRQARKIKTMCEKNPNDAIEIDFDQFAEFGVCAASHTPIYPNETSVACPFDGVKYHSKYKDSVCTVCEVCQIGAPASGLRLTI